MNKADTVLISLQVTKVVLASDEALSMTNTTSFSPAFSGMAPFSKRFLFTAPKNGHSSYLLILSLSVEKRVHSPIPQVKNLELSLVGPSWSDLGHGPTPNQSM